MRVIPSFLCGAVVSVLSFALSLPLAAQEPMQAAAAVPTVPATSGPEASPAGAPALTREDVEAWLDGFLPYALAAGDVAGAVGRTLLPPPPPHAARPEASEATIAIASSDLAIPLPVPALPKTCISPPLAMFSPAGRPPGPRPVYTATGGPLSPVRGDGSGRRRPPR